MQVPRCPAFAAARGAPPGGRPCSPPFRTCRGYLVGFVVAAALVGALAERGWTATAPRALNAMVLGNLVVYAFGVAWLAQLAPDLRTAIAWGVTPFLLGGALKVALATALLPLATRAQRPR